MARATQVDAPTALSSMPPTQQGIPAWAHRSWICTAGVNPPTRPGLTFTNRQLCWSIAWRGSEAGHAFVEADGRPNLPLERGVIEDVVVGEGLFDHCQLEFVEALKQRHVGQRVAAVAVDVDRLLRMLPADGSDDVAVPAGTELELDAGEAVIDGLADSGEQIVEGVHHAEIGSNGDGVPRGPEELVERLVFDSRLEIPPGGVEDRFGERVALEHAQTPLEVVSGREILMEQGGAEPVTADGEDAPRPFGAVAGGRKRAAFTPGGDGPAGQSAEDRLDGGIFAIGSPPGEDERHCHVEEFDPVNLHVGCSF